MPDSFLATLNEGVTEARVMRRVAFVDGISASAERWLSKKHAGGAVHEPATISGILAGRHIGRPIKSVWDVGALYGYFSLVAREVYPDAKVTAFEANPYGFAELSKNVAGRCIDACNTVISDEVKGPTKFWFSAFNLYEEPEKGWSDLPNQPGAMKHGWRGFASVPFTTLDAMARDIGSPDIIKIDVEAYQAKAVGGMPGLIRDHRPLVVIELHDPEKLARLGTTNAATVKPFFVAGYSAYWCGNIREQASVFEKVEAMEERHERLSVMVFAP